MDLKMIYLAERHARFTRAEWVERWRQHGGFCRTLPIWDHIRHYEQCVAIDGSDFVSSATVGPQPGAGGWDGVGMIWFWSMDALARAIDEPRRPELDADELETFSRPVADTTLLAREAVLHRRGGVNAKVITFIRRRPGISREEFSHHWEHQYAPLLLGCDGVSAGLRSYVQNHTLDATPEPMSAFDGVEEMGFASLEEATRALTSVDYLGDVKRDQLTFMDPTDAVVVTTDERLLYEDALGQERVLSLR